MSSVLKYCTVLATLIILNFRITETEIIGNKYLGIWNGDVVDIERSPFIASIRVRGDHACGGIIVNESFILTTATCFEMVGRVTKNISVVVGSNQLNTGGDVFNVTKIIVHGKYEEGKDYDIGLLKLGKNLDLSSKVAIASLAEKGTIYADGTTFEIIGWGTDANDTFGVLKKTTVSLVDNATCVERNSDEYVISNTTICAAEDDHGPCYGDLGTPLMLNGTVVGLTSRAKRCASARYPTVYTRVSEFRDWIDDAMKTKINDTS